MRRATVRHTLSLLCAGLCISTAQGHENKTSWHGTWVLGDSRVQINTQGFQLGSERCAWTTSKPTQPKACAAFDDLPVAKDQLVRLLDDAEVALKELSAKKTPNLQSRQRELQAARKTLQSVGSGEFRTVGIAGTASRPCATYFFLDRFTLYQVTDCARQPEAADLRAYKKAS